MVDVHGERRGLDERRLDDPALLRAVHGDEHALGDVLGRRPEEAPLLEPKERVFAGQRLRATEHHHGVLAEPDERQVRGEQRAERVAVGVVVGRHDKALAGPQRLDDRVHVTRGHRRLRRGRELVDQLGHADAVLDRAIVDELKAGRPAQTELLPDAALEDAGGPVERQEGLLPLALAAEHADPDLRVVEVARRLDRGHRDEADPRVLERGDRLREDLLHRFVDSTHPPAHRSPSSRWTSSRSQGPSSNAWPESQRSASSRRRDASPASRVTQASVSRERCHTSWWSTSAMEQPTRFASCCFTERRCIRFSLSEWLSGKWSSKVRMPT
jgi:hypothetical protein